MRFLMIALGGALGALTRYGVSTAVQARLPDAVPGGTFVVNMTGCLLMGFVSVLLTDRLDASPNWLYLVPIGFVGAYTTFSTFELDLLRAQTTGAWFIGSAYLAASVVAGYGALWLGMAIARAV
jgi:CrcB protein